MNLEVNVGEKDRMIRLGAGALLIVIALLGYGVLFAILGLALLATGYTRKCPGYQVLGKNTLEPKS
ncbi:MAG: DUF2892 domain-containing protein [Rhodobacteraceae bacterium]|nr:MAG: DUF2892 domain-containing protein [Paracoccaceae bacterium]